MFRMLTGGPGAKRLIPWSKLGANNPVRFLIWGKCQRYLVCMYDIYAEWNKVSFNCFYTPSSSFFFCRSFGVWLWKILFSSFHQGELTSESFQKQMCNSIIHYYHRFLIRILSKTSHLKATHYLYYFPDDMTRCIALICLQFYFYFYFYFCNKIKTNFLLMANVLTKHTTLIGYYFSDYIKYNDIKELRIWLWLFREPTSRLPSAKIQNCWT